MRTEQERRIESARTYLHHVLIGHARISAWNTANARIAALHAARDVLEMNATNTWLIELQRMFTLEQKRVDALMKNFDEIVDLIRDLAANEEPIHELVERAQDILSGIPDEL